MTNATKKTKAAEPKLPAQPPESAPEPESSSSEPVASQERISQTARPPGPPQGVSRPPGFGLDQPSSARPPAQPTRAFGLPPDTSQPREPGLRGLTQSSGSTFAGASQRRHSNSSDIYEPEERPANDVGHADANDLQRSRQKLDSLIDQFRSNRISKPKALAGIAGLIDDSSFLSDAEKDKTLKLYLEELESSIRDDAEPDFITELRNKRSNGINLDLGPSSSVASGSQRAESIDPEERPNKKKKLSLSDLGWTEDDSESPLGPLPLSCRKTLQRLDDYAQDISRCKFLVRSVRRAPTGIPDSQWERIFKGQALDLDHFLSSLHRTSIDEEGETRIGNAKISFGVSDAKRRVSTYGEWVSAWNLASSAVAFAFPHRTEELRVYGEFIGGEFGAKLPQSHPRVIMFDIAIRNHVQGGQSFLLNDHQQLLRFHSAILMPDGVEPSKKASGRRLANTSARASGSKTDICNRFNAASGCPSSDSDCRYRHICKTCKKAGHGKEQHEN